MEQKEGCDHARVHEDGSLIVTVQTMVVASSLAASLTL